MLCQLAGPLGAAELTKVGSALVHQRGQLLVAVHAGPASWQQDIDLRSPDFQALRRVMLRVDGKAMPQL